MIFKNKDEGWLDIFNKYKNYVTNMLRQARNNYCYGFIFYKWHRQGRYYVEKY